MLSCLTASSACLRAPSSKSRVKLEAETRKGPEGRRLLRAGAKIAARQKHLASGWEKPAARTKRRRCVRDLVSPTRNECPCTDSRSPEWCEGLADAGSPGRLPVAPCSEGSR